MKPKIFVIKLRNVYIFFQYQSNCFYFDVELMRKFFSLNLGYLNIAVSIGSLWDNPNIVRPIKINEQGEFEEM